MRWVIITQDFPPRFVGGIASWADDLAMALYNAGHDVMVVARWAGRGIERPFPIRWMRGRSWGRWQATWARGWTWDLMGEGTTVVCATWRLATQLSLRGGRLMIAFHGSDLTRLAAPPVAFTRVCQKADALLPVSSFLATELVRLGVTRESHVLPMPLAIPPWRDTERSGLLMVGRPTGLKGIDQAVALAKAVGEPLTLVGIDGPVEGATCLGELPRSEVLDLYWKAKGVVLLPGLDAEGRGAEGFGLCLLEGGLRGAIPIGNQVGGVPEAVGAGVVLERDGVVGVKESLADPLRGRVCREAVEAHYGPLSTLQQLIALPEPQGTDHPTEPTSGQI